MIGLLGEIETPIPQVAGVRIRAPMMLIHTVAAGGGSLCVFEGGRIRVGPQSAGANPGPCAYRRGGALAVTDCNVMLGRLQPDFFPKVFGPHQVRVHTVKSAFKWSSLAVFSWWRPTGGATRLGVWARPPALSSPLEGAGREAHSRSCVPAQYLCPAD